ncbi:MAG: class I SAM-dependent methyltransferase [Anaerolineaceae bacterium]|nr:class I SAM-dependent methyltransferase [Anaerolineaceae bacterium]
MDGQSPTGTWADLGSGEGAFTLALAELLDPQAEIYSLDRNPLVLRRQQQAFTARYPQRKVHLIRGDFTAPMQLPRLDGLVIANALHFVPDDEKLRALLHIKSYLKPGGRFLLVEYDAGQGNQWVPYPFTYSQWETLTTQAGLSNTRKLAERPSRFLHAIYSAVSWNLPA